MSRKVLLCYWFWCTKILDNFASEISFTRKYLGNSAKIQRLRLSTLLYKNSIAFLRLQEVLCVTYFFKKSINVNEMVGTNHQVYKL